MSNVDMPRLSSREAHLDWLTFFSTTIKSLAWPMVAIISLLVLRKDAGSLLNKLGSRLQKAKGPYGEITFGEGIDGIENKLPPSEPSAPIEVIDTNKIDDVSELARLPPPYIVSQAWIRLEHKIKSAIDARLINKQEPVGGRRLSLRAYLNLLTVHGVLPQEDLPVLIELQNLRNRAAHSLDPNISVTDALRYNDIVDSLIRKIEHQEVL